MTSLYPPTYEHCVSFWWPAGGGNSFGGSSVSAWLRRVVCDVAGDDNVVGVEQEGARYVPPASAAGERSRVGLTFRVVYQSTAEALSRAAAAALQAEVRLQLGLMGVELR